MTNNQCKDYGAVKVDDLIQGNDLMRPNICLVLDKYTRVPVWYGLLDHPAQVNIIERG